MEDNFEDFDFNSYMDESNKNWDAKMEVWKERMVAEAIEMNYNNIKENGICDWHARHLTKEELLALQETMHFMIDHYVESEEYEKCALLKKELIKIDSLLSKL